MKHYQKRLDHWLKIKRMYIVNWILVMFLFYLTLANYGQTTQKESKPTPKKKKILKLKLKPQVKLVGIKPGTKIYGGSIVILTWRSVGVNKVTVKLVRPTGGTLQDKISKISHHKTNER